MNSLLCTLACLAMLPLAARAEDRVLVTLKLVKVNGAPAQVPISLEFPNNCKGCEAIEDSAYARQNTREVILAMRIPAAMPLDLRVKTDGSAFRRVTLETVDLHFAKSSEGLSFTMPAQIADRPNSGEFQTHLYWPGVELRVEHADPARRFGDYAQGEFPTAQHQAALNLEFGMLEAIRRLGLDHYVDDQNLGRLFLMGFDTNYPHGHSDFPPHFHLALWLSSYRAYGSLIPHFYLSKEGLIESSMVTPYPWPLKPSEYKTGESLTITDTLTRAVYSLKITPEGWLNLHRYDGASCSLRPHGKGFAGGIRVTCANFLSFSVHVEDDLGKSEVHESIDGKVTASFLYDPDTGALLAR